MKTIILCGGQGARLREETEFRPKPMVEVGGRPLVWHIMKHFAHYGLNEFILCLGYKGQMIKDYFLRYRELSTDITVRTGNGVVTYHGASPDNFTVTLVDTGESAGTAERLNAVQQYVAGYDSFVYTYGDGVSDVDIKALVSFHNSHSRIATVTAVRPVGRFGTLHVQDDGLVSQFREKPVDHSARTNAGYFVLHQRVFDYLGMDSMFEFEPMSRLVNTGELMAYQHDGFFFAMDTYREYQQLKEMWDMGNAPWKVWR